MQNIRQKLIEDVEDFMNRTGVSKTTIGRTITNSSMLIDSIRDGASITVDTVEKIYAFMRSHENNNSAPAAPVNRRNREELR